MSKQVQGPDGQTYEFPDDVTDDELVRFFEEREGTSPTHRGAVASVAREHAHRTGRRSLWERLTDNTSDTWNTGWVSEGWRAGRLEGAQNAAGELTVDEVRGRDGVLGQLGLTNPARGFGRAYGAASQALFPGTLAEAKGDVTDERERREALAATNDRERGGDSFLSYFRDGDPVGGVTHGAAALLGTLAGAAADPLSYVTGGESLLAKVLTQGAVAAAGDAMAQDSSLDAGVQDRFDAGRLALSAAAGSAFTLSGELLHAAPRFIRERFLRQPEADVRADLDVADDLMRPTMSEQDIPATPPPEVTSGLPEGATVVRRVEGGGPLPGDVWNPELNAWMHRVDGPTTEPAGKPAAESVEAQQAPPAPLFPATPEGHPRAAQESPEGIEDRPPLGDGLGGWSDVDWTRRPSPERARAAVDHLDKLKAWIKPEHVADFIHRMDAGTDELGTGTYLDGRWVNWDAFREDPQSLMGLHTVLGDVFSDRYETAGLKRQGWEETRTIAKQMGSTLADAIRTHADVTGEGGLTVKMFAMRDAFNASVDDAASRMRETLADIRAGNFRAAAIEELSALIQRSAILGRLDDGATSEVARALNAKKALAKAAVPDLQSALDGLNAAMLGNGEIRDQGHVEKIITDLLDGYDKQGPAGFNSRLRRMRSMGFLDYVGYVAVANLLSGLPTHVRNAVGTPTHALLDLSARFTAATVVAPIRRALLGSTAVNSRSVTVRETVAYVQGTYDALGDAVRLGLQALKKGAPVADDVSGIITDTRQVPFALSRERLAKWQRQGFTLGTVGDMTGVAFFEVLRTLGFRPSVAADEFNKGLARSAGLNALAYREAAYEAAKRGPGREADKAFVDTVAAIRSQPTAEAIAAAKAMFGPHGESADGTFDVDSPEFQMQAILRSIDARQAAAEHAQLLAYQKTGRTIEDLERFLRRIPIVKHFAANFVRTPTQLFQAAFRDYNPVTAPVVLAFEATTRAGRERHAAFFAALRGEEEALAGGGAAAEMVIARQLVGAGILGVIYGYWADGNIVGADIPEGDEYAGVLPYSIRLPGTQHWVQFTGYSPLAEHLGLVADLGQIMRTKDLTDDQEFSLVGALAVAIRGNVFNKSFLKGIADLIDVMDGGDFKTDDPRSTADGMGKGALSLLLGRAIPASSFIKRWAQSGDPVVRDARGWAEQVAAYLPGLSETLTAKRDFMGRLVIRKPGERGVFQVAKTSAPTEDPLDRELANLANNPRVNLRITPTPGVLDGERLTSAEHNRLQEIQGQLVRDRRTGWNMEETLRDLITTDGYREADPAYRETLIKRVISDFREEGKKAAFDPDGPYYMRDLVERTSPQRLAHTARSRGWTAEEAMGRRGRSYGLGEGDMEMLREALDTVD